LRGGKEIVLDHITDLGRDRNDDHVLLGWGLDAILYRLVECKHNPPHHTKRRFTDPNDQTGTLQCYHRKGLKETDISQDRPLFWSVKQLGEEEEDWDEEEDEDWEEDEWSDGEISEQHSF
jgi:hypothetical protein